MSDLMIGFPDGILFHKAIRIPVLENCKNKFVAIDKPANVLFDADNKYYRGYPSVLGGIKVQKNKPEFERLFLKNPLSIVYPDKEISGVSIAACTKEVATDLRNMFGSSFMKFEFLLLSEKPIKEIKTEIDLPIARHDEKAKAIVTHGFGKKTLTKFSLIEDLDRWQLWQASTNFLRWHQIRLHAYEAGLRVVNDYEYCRTKPLLLSGIIKSRLNKIKEDENPIYDNVYIHLSKISFNYNNTEFNIESSLPSGFEATLKRIRRANSTVTEIQTPNQ